MDEEEPVTGIGAPMAVDRALLSRLYPSCPIEGISDELLALLPVDKDDRARVQEIERLGYPRVMPIVPHLLSWLQDINWPVAGYLLPFLLSIREHIIEEIRDILHADDLIHIRWVLEHLIDDPEALHIAARFTEELSRLTRGQDEGEVFVVAGEILDWLKESEDPASE